MNMKVLSLSHLDETTIGIIGASVKLCILSLGNSMCFTVVVVKPTIAVV